MNLKAAIKKTFLYSLYKLLRSKYVYLLRQYYYKERKKYIHGMKNGKKVYYLIQRRGSETVGLCSHFITNIAQIKYAIDCGYVPYIDMETIKNLYNQGETVNSWEFYFQQPNKEENGIGYKQFVKNKNIILSRNYAELKEFPNSNILNDSERTSMWHYYYKHYMKLNLETDKYIETEYHRLINENDKVLGVLCRGTDYISLKPPNHPVQPDINQMIEKIEQVYSEQKCTKIYLVTEDATFYDKISSRFPDIVVSSNKNYVEYNDENEKEYIGNVLKEKCDIRQNGLEYLTSIVILSRCNCIVAGRTSGTIAAHIMADGKFEYAYYFDLGRYT